MKPTFLSQLRKPGAMLALAAACALGSGTAQAAGTLAGTPITNLATLTYSVGSTAQSPIGSSATGNTTGAGTATSFIVDNKINLLLVRDTGTFVTVVPGTNGVAPFTLTNTGNSTQDYSLSSTSTLSSTSLGGVTDNFDPTSCSVFVESGANGGYQPAEDTATFVDELAPDATKTIYAVCAIPLSRIDGDGAVIALTATALVGGAAGQGAALVQSTGANTEFVAGVSSGIDIVFADAADLAGGPARDAKYSARDVFKVETAKLTVTKTVTLICDPFNGDVNPKAIPGSIVRYKISVANTGTVTATLTQMTDALNAAVALDPNLVTGAGTATPATSCALATGAIEGGRAAGSGFKVELTGTTRASAVSYFTTTSSADGIDFASPNITVNFSLVLPNEGGYLPGHLKKDETVSVIYQVQIN